MTEFQYALSLGIGITTNMAPSSVVGTNKVEAVKFKGRAKVTEKSELKLEANTVVFAIGQGAEDFSNLAPVKLTEKGMVKATAKGKTSTKKYFAGGDIVNGGKTVVEAVASGKEAAASIIEFLENVLSDNLVKPLATLSTRSISSESKVIDTVLRTVSSFVSVLIIFSRNVIYATSFSLICSFMQIIV